MSWLSLQLLFTLAMPPITAPVVEAAEVVAVAEVVEAEAVEVVEVVVAAVAHCSKGLYKVVAVLCKSHRRIPAITCLSRNLLDDKKLLGRATQLAAYIVADADQRLS